VTDCTKERVKFPVINRKEVEVNFSGGDLSSDGGALLVSAIDNSLQLCNQVSKIIPDTRNPKYIIHSMESLVKQRVYGLCLGYEDVNDHNNLRHDPVLQTALGREELLASSASLCRFDNRGERKCAVAIHKIMLSTFIKSFKVAPKRLVLDLDSSDIPIYGHQEGKFFHGYYAEYCFLPLYVFCGKQLLVNYLRPARKDPALHAGAVIKLLVQGIREAFPNVEIIIRGDGGFSREYIMNWCERNGVKFIFGLAKNARLKKKLQERMEEAEQQFKATNDKQRLFTEFTHAALTWKQEYRVIGKAEHTDKGCNPRFIITNIKGGKAKTLYDEIYCKRGNMENHIKAQHLDLFGTRTSCHLWWSNQLRCLLSSLAYILLDRMRATALKNTKLANATLGSIRLKLLKIAAIVIKNSRRIQIRLVSHCPYKKTYLWAAQQLVPG
jgi:Transposase DDE domain group 1